MEMVDFLGFDPSNFQKAAKAVVTGFNQVAVSVKNAAATVGGGAANMIKGVTGKVGTSIKGMGSGISKIGGGAIGSLKGIGGQIAGGFASAAKMALRFAGPLAAIGAGFLTVRSAMDNMPEIGQTFKIAGDIIMKNFWWPIRQFLIPYLQKVLNWVGQNRLMFVKWGAAALNIFRVIIQLGKAVFGFISSALGPAVKKIGDIFGLTSMGIDEMLNLLALKFGVIVAVISPYLKKLGDLISPVFTLVIDYYKEIINTIGKSGIFESIQNMVTEIGKFWDTFKGSDAGGIAIKVFGQIKALILDVGTIVGVMIVRPLLAMVDVIKAIAKVATAMMKGEFAAVPGIIKDELVGASMNQINLVLDAAKKIAARHKAAWIEEPVKDAIIRPDGKVIRTDPEDTLVAMKRPALSLRGRGGMVSIGSVIGSMALTVTEGDAKSAGENLALGLGDKLRAILQREMVMVGDL